MSTSSTVACTIFLDSLIAAKRNKPLVGDLRDPALRLGGGERVLRDDCGPTGKRVEQR